MTNEERAVWIGERLFSPQLNKDDLIGEEYYALNNGKFLATENYIKWLSSPNGISAVKVAMIEKGYCLQIAYNADGKWLCMFIKGFISWRGVADTEAEAVLFATELTLKWIEENPELALKMEGGS